LFLCPLVFFFRGYLLNEFLQILRLIFSAWKIFWYVFSLLGVLIYLPTASLLIHTWRYDQLLLHLLLCASNFWVPMFLTGGAKIILPLPTLFLSVYKWLVWLQLLRWWSDALSDLIIAVLTWLNRLSVASIEVGVVQQLILHPVLLVLIKFYYFNTLAWNIII